MTDLRIAFAGDRDISVLVLGFLHNQGIRPAALLVSQETRATHADELIAACPYLAMDFIFRGTGFRESNSIEKLRGLDLDYLIGVHFPYIIPEDILTIPRVGVLNLHPAFLPFNRGWHTPSLAILEDTPIGATLHFMDAGIDTGDIVHQKHLQVTPADTAHTLYQRLKQLELETFQEAWPSLVERSFHRLKQDPEAGSVHRRSDLFCESLQRIDLNQVEKVADLLRRLRALTTNRIDEAAYFQMDGKRYRIQVIIQEE